MNSHGSGGTLGKIRIHRTKCAALTKNVISPCLKDELKHDAEGKKFVLIMDESTGVGVQKLLCVTVTYLSSTGGHSRCFLGTNSCYGNKC